MTRQTVKTTTSKKPGLGQRKGHTSGRSNNGTTRKHR